MNQKLFKVFQIIQFSILGFVLGFILSHIINSAFLIDFDKDNPTDRNINKYIILLYSLYDLIIITLTIIVIRKIIIYISELIPGERAHPAETALGFVIGIGFVYNRSVQKFSNKVDVLFQDYDYWK